jgi:hypothetical protein
MLYYCNMILRYTNKKYLCMWILSTNIHHFEGSFAQISLDLFFITIHRKTCYVPFKPLIDDCGFISSRSIQSYVTDGIKYSTYLFVLLYIAASVSYGQLPSTAEGNDKLREDIKKSFHKGYKGTHQRYNPITIPHAQCFYSLSDKQLFTYKNLDEK